MSELKIYTESSALNPKIHSAHTEIARALEIVGIDFQQWQAEAILAEQAQQDEILMAYRKSIDKLMTENGYVTVDVIRMKPDHPDKQALRKKFLSEHEHSEDEVRFFVEGKGLFCIHKAGKVYALLCEKGDLVSVPANTPHWFDMGSEPNFTCIRLFNNPAGWVANYTGNDIAERFPKFGE